MFVMYKFIVESLEKDWKSAGRNVVSVNKHLLPEKVEFYLS